MTTLFPDTSEEAEAVLLELLRQMPAWRKLQMVSKLNATIYQLMMAGIRKRHPHANEAELFRRYADLSLGPELAHKVYGPLPPENPPGDL